jgi:L-lactate dehydrogenase
MPIAEYMKKAGLEWTEELMAQMENDARTMGAQIIKAKGKTHYGIATSVCYIADAVLNQVPTVVPVASPFHGEYGINGVSISVPSVVSGQGVEARLECKFSDAEMDKLLKSAATLKAMIDSL